MPETLHYTPLDPAILPNDREAEERRWAAWQQRGFARDARNRRRMGAFAAFAVLALAVLGGLLVFGAS